MTYSIFDTGNLVASFEREDAAREALARIAEEAPEARDRLLLVAFDDDGRLVGEIALSESLAPGFRVASTS
jgi:predicted N-acetyltransferase YhbS